MWGMPEYAALCRIECELRNAECGMEVFGGSTFVGSYGATSKWLISRLFRVENINSDGRKWPK